MSDKAKPTGPKDESRLPPPPPFRPDPKLVTYIERSQRPKDTHTR